MSKLLSIYKYRVSSGMKVPSVAEASPIKEDTEFECKMDSPREGLAELDGPN